MSEPWQIFLFEGVAVFIAIAAAATAVLRLERRRRAIQWAVMAAILALSFIPINGLNGSQYVLTIVGHLSLTSVSLLVAWIVRCFWLTGSWKRVEKELISAVVFVCGALLYLAAFGVITFDLYQTGYGSAGFAAILAGAAIVAAIARFNIAFIALLSAAAAFQLHLLWSNNIWDYLIDPLLVIYAAVTLSITAYNAIRRRRKAPADIQ